MYRTSFGYLFAHGGPSLPNTGNCSDQNLEKRGCGRLGTGFLGASGWLNYSSMICGLYISCQDSCDKTHYCNTLEILKLFLFCFIIYELSWKITFEIKFSEINCDTVAVTCEKYISLNLTIGPPEELRIKNSILFYAGK